MYNGGDSSSSSSGGGGGGGSVRLGLPGKALVQEGAQQQQQQHQQQQQQQQLGDPFASKLGGRPVRGCVLLCLPSSNHAI